jgi:TonB family protein
MHAAFTYDADKGQDFVTLYPDPRRKDLATKVDTSLATPSYSCTLRVTGRCLVALGHVEYPWEAKRNSVAGSVTLSGIIGRDGKLKDVRATKTDANPALLDYSLRNLRNWRFEPGENNVSLLITYSFQLVSSPIFENGPNVQISLPDRVTVTDNPLH